jgi:predicted nucleic acid-binding protein
MSSPKPPAHRRVCCLAEAFTIMGKLVVYRRVPRVVIDNGLVLAALVFGGGAPARLRQAWQAQRVRPMMCLAILYDLHCRLAAPELGLSGNERQRLLDEYLPHTKRVQLAPREGAVPAQDPPAMAMVRLAAAVRAHAIVSADAGLLALDGKLGCRVLGLDALLDELPASRTRSKPVRVVDGGLFASLLTARHAA